MGRQNIWRHALQNKYFMAARSVHNMPKKASTPSGNHEVLNEVCFFTQQLLCMPACRHVSMLTSRHAGTQAGECSKLCTSKPVALATDYPQHPQKPPHFSQKASTSYPDPKQQRQQFPRITGSPLPPSANLLAWAQAAARPVTAGTTVPRPTLFVAWSHHPHLLS